jgi:TatD DNase family protein
VSERRANDRGGTWVDSHCHLGWDGDGDGNGPAVEVEEAVAAGVSTMVCVGTDLETSRRAVTLARRHPEVWATVGLHPHEASGLDVQWDELVVLAEQNADVVVGIGETGFDHYYEHSHADAQEVAFRKQIELARRLDVALVVHSRDAWNDTFRVLTDVGVPTRTVLHCFTGGPIEARRGLDVGAYLSYSGVVSFKNADDVRAAAASTPLDRVLVETDSPFLAPVPHRGKPNRPAWVVDVGAALAAAMGRPLAEVAGATTRNAATVFGSAVLGSTVAGHPS